MRTEDALRELTPVAITALNLSAARAELAAAKALLGEAAEALNDQQDTWAELGYQRIPSTDWLIERLRKAAGP